MRTVPAVARAQFGVFTAAQARSAGWTMAAVEHALAVGDLVRIRRGLYAPALEATDDPHADRLAAFRREAAAVSISNRRVPVSHLAASALHGCWLLDDPTRVCVTYARGRRDTIEGVHRHRGQLRRGEIGRYGPVTLLSPARTVFDVGCEHGAQAGIVCADSALRSGLVTAADLDAVCADRDNWGGSRAAKRAIALADPRAESALESISRLAFDAWGLPPPRPQVRIFTTGGRLLGRVDFYWDQFGVAGEADGLAKYRKDEDALGAQRIRQGAMEDCGLIVERWRWDIRTSPEPVIARLQRAFARGVCSDRAPRLWIPKDATAWPRADQAS